MKRLLIWMVLLSVTVGLCGCTVDLPKPSAPDVSATAAWTPDVTNTQIPAPIRTDKIPRNTVSPNPTTTAGAEPVTTPAAKYSIITEALTSDDNGNYISIRHPQISGPASTVDMQKSMTA